MANTGEPLGLVTETMNKPCNVRRKPERGDGMSEERELRKAVGEWVLGAGAVYLTMTGV